MSAFSVFEHDVLNNAAPAFAQALSGLVNEAIDDTKAFLQNQAQNLMTWTQQLASQQIDQQEFEFLVRGQAAVTQMHALTQAGIALAQAQRFRDTLVNIIVNAAIKNFIP